MLKNKTHNYIIYLLKKLDKKYNKNITLYYNPKCNRTNMMFHEDTNTHVFEYGDRLITDALEEKSHYRDYLRYVVAHEYGHIYHNLPYETFNEKVENEYCAERFALNYLKEYYPKTYRWACKVGYSLVDTPKWGKCKSEKHYRKAFERIEEYV